MQRSIAIFVRIPKIQLIFQQLEILQKLTPSEMKKPSNCFLFKILIISGLFFISQKNLFAQENYPQKKFTKTAYNSQLQNLRQKFGQNKIIPKKIELACLIALAHYPELKEIKIEFRYQK